MDQMSHSVILYNIVELKYILWYLVVFKIWQSISLNRVKILIFITITANIKCLHMNHNDINTRIQSYIFPLNPWTFGKKNLKIMCIIWNKNHTHTQKLHHSLVQLGFWSSLLYTYSSAWHVKTFNTKQQWN